MSTGSDPFSLPDDRSAEEQIADLKRQLFDKEEAEREAAAAAMERAGWPPALQKAACDPFQYAAYVEHLGIIWFESCDDLGNGWVGLHPGNWGGENRDAKLPFPFCRGVNVRLEDIRWVADAPNGS